MRRVRRRWTRGGKSERRRETDEAGGEHKEAARRGGRYIANPWRNRFLHISNALRTWSTWFCVECVVWGVLPTLARVVLAYCTSGAQ